MDPVLYNAMIKPLFMYCSIVWSSCSNDNIMKLFKLQKCAAHIECWIMSSICRCIRQTKLATFQCWIKYKEVHGGIQSDQRRCSWIFETIISAKQWSTRNARLTFFTSRYNGQTEGGRSFAVRNSKFWNSLPFEIRSSHFC